ncbi:MAG TPA: homoserine kinase [Alphaproteobacteria bacterium]|nr:homoserine kinase [Alphaproteobacteria bacterium]HAJ48094.1 homoserine kinase [Alphaproteobacteria bacterium]
MAVYTDVPDDVLLALLEMYEIGTPVAFKGIAEGVENSNFLLQTTTGNFLLTLYEKRVAAAELPFFIALMKHLAGAGLPCPLPVADRDGQILQTLCGRHAAIVTFLPGLSPKRPDARQCASAGMALARLHLAGASFPLTRANSMGPKVWRSLFEPNVKRADEISEGLAGLIGAELDVLMEHWPQSLPAGIVHADLFPDNVLFIGTTISGLIDFYFACTDAFAYDVAICLNSWCFEPDGTFNVTKSRAFLAAYHAVRPLEAAELRGLSLLCRGAALRFLLTRLHDWLHRDTQALVRPKNPLEFLQRLRFHQRVVDSSEYGLMDI